MTDEDAIREIGWVAREAVAVITGDIGRGSPRAQEYVARKRALLDYIESRRQVTNKHDS